MATIKKVMYQYEFNQIKSEDAFEFNLALEKIFEYCRNDSQKIVEFLQDSLGENRVKNLRTVLAETAADMTETDKLILKATQDESIDKK